MMSPTHPQILLYDNRRIAQWPCIRSTESKIHTSFDYPPIPVRSFDWSAVTDDYDCDCDQDGFFSTCPIGHGATEEDAIADLIEQIEDRAFV